MKTTKFLLRMINLLVVFAMTFSSPMSAVAKVWTDQEDYSPGSVVTIQGNNEDNAGYLPGETVHVDVAGPNGYTAACEGLVDDTGAWSCPVTLWNSLDAVGSYTYTATGLTSLVTQTGAFSDSGGSYTLNWTAADPQVNNAPYLPTYTKVPPAAKACPTPSGSSGRAADPMQHAIFGSPKDSVESLAPPSMALGQIVPFEVKISVSGSTAPEGGVILLTPYWLTKTSSGGNFGYDPAYEVYCAFVDTADAASIDPGGNAKVDSWTDTVVNTGTSNEQIQATLQVSGLDNGDSVIVEIWVVLKNTIPQGVTGNVQTGLISAQTKSGETINTGKQTVPLLQVGSFFTSDADLSVTKSDSPDPVQVGKQLAYSLVVKNNSTTVVANGVVVTDTLDPNTTFVSGSWPGGTCTAAGGVVTCNVGALMPLQEITISLVVNVNATAPYLGTVSTGTCTLGAAGVDLCNRVSVTAITRDLNTANNSDSEPTNVEVTSALTIDKTATPKTYNAAGAVISYSYVVTNNGNVTLSGPFKVVDDKASDEACPATPATLAPGASITCTASYTIAQADLEAGSVTNVAYATAALNGTEVRSNTDTETVTATVSAALTLDKTAAPTTYNSVGQVISYSYLLTNSGNVTLSGPFTVTDNKATVSCPATPAALAPLASTTCTASYTITAADLDAGSVTNTAKGHAFFGTTQVDSNEDSATVTAQVTATLTIAKTTNGSDGPTILVGQPVTWTYVVANTGNVTISSIAVTDDKLVAITCPKTALAAGESMTCTASGTAVAGNYSNTGTVTGTYGTTTVTASDTSSYFGAAPAIDVQKTPDTQTVIYGQAASFTIVVKNTGNVDLTGVVVTDEQAPDCAKTIGGLAAGAEVPYTCSLANVTAGFTNTAVVTGDYGGKTVTDSDSADVAVDVLPDITVTKTAAPTAVPETGGDVVFTFVVTNNSSEPFLLNSLKDDKYGDLDGQGSCDVPQTIAAGGTYSCAVTKFLASDTLTDHTNVVMAAGTDEQGNPDSATDSETVTFTDVKPTVDLTKTVTPDTLAEPGGAFVYTLTITNTSPEAVKITALTDDNTLSQECTALVNTSLAAGATTSCTYMVTRTEPGTYPNTASVTVTDNDGSTATDTGSASVSVTNVAPSVDLTKTADPLTLAEPGGFFTFTLTIKNTSIEPVTITALSDTNALSDECKALVNTSLAAGETVTCTYTVTYSDAGIYNNTASVTVTDNDNATATASATATVAVTDVMPTVDLTKSASPSTLPEPGGVFTYTLTIKNTSVEAVTITALIDDNTLSTGCTALIGAIIPASESVTCTYTVTHTDTGSYPNTASVTVTDNEGNAASDSDNKTVTVTDVMPDIAITKTASPKLVPETGGDVTFAFVVTNNGPEAVTLTSLIDSKFGDLNGQGTCIVPQTIAAGGTYTCAVTKLLASDTLAAHTNVVTATAKDNDGNTDTATDDETVTFTDVAPAIEITKTASTASVPETGADVTFTFLVKNIGMEDVTLASLVDTKLGDLDGKGTCAVPQAIAVGGEYSCTYTVFLASDSLTAHTNVVTATAVDDDNTPATDTDEETVTFTDVAPLIRVTKTANPTGVPESGGLVTFTFLVENIGQEDVTLNSLTDDKLGNLAGAGSCALPQTIPMGGSYTCTFSIKLSSDNLTPHTNVVTATAVDDDGTPATGTDAETVTFTNVPPEITVTKTANRASVPETGGDVTFTFRVENTGDIEAVTITSLIDSVFGPLAGDENCKVGHTLAVNAYCEFSITKWVEGDFSGPDHVNVFTAKAVDNDNSEAMDDDDATVDFTNVLPSIDVTKTANPTAVPETGGDVTFTFTVKNTSTEEPVTITSLSDSLYGDLAGDDDCKLGTILAAGASCEFAITEWVEGDYSGPDHVNVFTAKAVDNDNTEATDSDSETIDFTNVAPTIDVTKTASPLAVPETGGDVTFTFAVKNTSTEEPVTITSLSDSVYGTLTGDVDCKVGTVLAAGASCEFTLTKWVAGDFSGPDHTNTFTGKAVDNDNTEATDSDNETVDFTDVAPTVRITKTANPTSVPETGGDVTFAFLVENLSQEAVTLTSLTDTVFGDLDGKGSCDVPQPIVVGGSYNCTYTVFLASDSLTAHTNVSTATVTDNDGTTGKDDDEETVTFEDVAPAIRMTKTADPTHVLETGGNVTFTFLVENIGQEDVMLTSLSDTVFGELDGKGTCDVPQEILIGGSYSCTYTIFLASDSLTAHNNAVTATAVDDDNTPATGTDDETVEFDDVAPLVQITKTASPTHVPETGGDVTFTFLVENIGQEDFTLTTLSDTVYGDLNGKGTCAVPQTIPIGQSYTCAYTIFLSSDSLAPHYNVSTATVVDDDQTTGTDDDDETVTFDDVKPDISVTKTAAPTSVPETGGDVTFSFVVKNNGLEAAVISGLSDSVYGTLAGDADCKVGTVLAAGASCEFTLTEWVEGDFSGDDHTNTFTGKATDNDGNEDTATDDATVDFTDVAPAIDVTKTASQTAVPETGGDVTFTFTVKNTSTEEAVTITSLTDSVYGPLNGDEDCKVGTVLAAGASCEFAITQWVEGDFSGDDHVNTFTAVAKDNDNTEATDSDTETVDFTNVLPTIDVTKTADPTAVPETGGNVTFTFVVKNTSTEEPVTITSLSDTVYGTLTGDADCKVGTVLAAGASCEFTLTKWVEGDFSGPDHANTFTGKAVDNDNTEATDSDTAAVDFTNVLPTLDVTKTASPTSVPETGGSVTFTFEVKNTSTEEPVTITSLSDTVYGTLTGDADCKVGTVLAASASCTFSITRTVAGDFSGPDHSNTFTAKAVDNDNTEATDTDNETVILTDVLPDISATKTASEKQVFKPGEDVIFTFTVKNNGLEAATISGLSDTVYGTLAGGADCKVGTVLAAGSSCTFSLTAKVTADHTNTFSAKATDNDGNSDEASATATVDMINPSIAITKVTVDGTTEGDALNILIGEAITWKYTVTNNGDVAISGITVTDSKGVSITCPKTALAAGESMTCTATGTAVTGSYSNTGTASITYTDTDGDTATRSASDGSSYFGADPQISIVKTTADAYGHEGDNVGILIGETVTWKYVVTNTGNVPLSSVGVTDDMGVTVTCPKTTLAVGETTTCTATGTAAAGWYKNVGTASGSFTDGGGHTRTDTASDSSAYYGLIPGTVTNSSLCDFGETFRLVFTPDMQRYTSSTPYYKLSDSNPGQFFYNLFYTNTVGTKTFALEIPYPYVTQGAQPVHVYGGVTVDPGSGGTPSPDNLTNCYVPQNTLASYGTIITLASYTDTNGDGKIGFGDVYKVNVPATSGFQYVNIHLDYGLEKTHGWLKKGANVTGDPLVNPAIRGISINDHTAHTFKAYADGVLIPGTTDTVYNTNEFKQIRGFGGLVYSQVTMSDGTKIYVPLQGAQIQLINSRGTLLGTWTTDADGWYLSTYVHSGKAATYTIRLVATAKYPQQTVTVTVGGNVKYGEGTFHIPPMP